MSLSAHKVINIYHTTGRIRQLISLLVRLFASLSLLRDFFVLFNTFSCLFFAFRKKKAGKSFRIRKKKRNFTCKKPIEHYIAYELSIVNYKL